MRVVPAVCHLCKHHSWKGPLAGQREYPYPRDRWWETLWHRTIRGGVRCQLAVALQRLDCCTIETNSQYTRETPEQCPHKFEMAVARGMK